MTLAERKIKASDVYDRIDVSRATFYRCLRGLSADLRTMARIARHLEMPFDIRDYEEEE